MMSIRQALQQVTNILDFIGKHFGFIDNRNSMIAANAKQARESKK